MLEIDKNAPSSILDASSFCRRAILIFFEEKLGSVGLFNSGHVQWLTCACIVSAKSFVSPHVLCRGSLIGGLSQENCIWLDIMVSQ